MFLKLSKGFSNPDGADLHASEIEMVVRGDAEYFHTGGALGAGYASVMIQRDGTKESAEHAVPNVEDTANWVGVFAGYVVDITESCLLDAWRGFEINVEVSRLTHLLNLIRDKALAIYAHHYPEQAVAIAYCVYAPVDGQACVAWNFRAADASTVISVAFELNPTYEVKATEPVAVADEWDMGGLDLDSAEKAVSEKQEAEQAAPAPIADNDCGDSCTI